MLEETMCSETPEIQKVMSILDKEISLLDENLNRLTQKLNPILQNERPTEVGKDRAKRDTDLGENIQKDIDAINRINELINELYYRVAL